MSKKLSEVLKDQKFCLLTTFRKNGDAVSCPMWFALKGEMVYMTTRGQSWKVKRIARNAEVKITWSNGSGSRYGKGVKAEALVLREGEEFEDARTLLAKKYGLQKKLIDFGLRFASDKTEAILKVARPDKSSKKTKASADSEASEAS